MVDKNEFEEHIEDRLLYANDLIETLKVSLNNLNNLYANNISTRLNESMHRLTILGTLFLIPTLIASLFGMNMPLPQLNFWEVVTGSLLISVSVAFALKKAKWF